MRAGERDCPQDDQELQTSTEFRFEKGLSIVFVLCCEQYFIPLIQIYPTYQILRFDRNEKVQRILEN